jgi:inward rectifier potassium channel
VARQRYESDVVVEGAAPHPLRDLYHSALRASWGGILGGIAAVFLAMNALFALGYVATGGVSGAHAGSFRDAFFFSVQTMGTVGYGAMYPASTAANTLVVAESVAGLILTALATGIVFARFSRTMGELVFSRHACVSPMDGIPTLAFRIGNDRASSIFEAHVSVTAIRTEHTEEGVLFYRIYDLPLVRAQSQVLERSFLVMHRLDDESPLRRVAPDTPRPDELELSVSVVGTDDTSLQPVHARHRYELKDILWGARLADILSERPDGRLTLDLRKFHDTVPTKPTATFPYPM